MMSLIGKVIFVIYLNTKLAGHDHDLFAMVWKCRPLVELQRYLFFSAHQFHFRLTRSLNEAHLSHQPLTVIYIVSKQNTVFIFIIDLLGGQ